MPERPDVSVVVVTYRSEAFVDACLRSLDAAAEGASYELIVADNASGDGTADMVRRLRPDAHVIETGANLGFAKAVNRGMSCAGGRHILLLNPDTELAPGSIARLIAFLDTTPAAAVAAPRLLNGDLSDQGTARSFPTAAAALFGRRSPLTRMFPGNRWTRRYLVGRQRSTDEPFEVDWVSGACLVARRDAIGRVGLLDEGFFMYWEDADWCRRFKDAGFGVFCVPSARVVHREGRSSVGRRARLVWVFHRSAYRYYTKHHARGAWRALRGLVAVGLTVRALAIIAISGAALGPRAQASDRR